MKKQDARHNSPSAQAAIRLQVVKFLRNKKRDKSCTQQRAAELYGLSIQGVKKIWKQYKEGGIRAIEEKKRGVKEGKKISGKQAAEIRRLVKDRMPDQLKLPFALWTREAVQQLIFRLFEIELSRWQVGRYLKRWGYTPQKPIAKAFEQKAGAVKAWLEVEYPAIKKKAIKENALIFWEDETGMRSDHQAGRSYAPKGKTPVITKTGQRFSINLISALSNKGHLEFMLLDGTFNSEVFIEFLGRLIKHKRQKIYLIVDGHPAHKTKKVQAWLEENKKRIEMYFLPAYSPELNPDELVNQDLKTNAIGKHRAINKEQLKANALNLLERRKKDPKQVQKYFHGKHVRYAA